MNSEKSIEDLGMFLEKASSSFFSGFFDRLEELLRYIGHLFFIGVTQRQHRLCFAELAIEVAVVLSSGYVNSKLHYSSSYEGRIMPARHLIAQHGAV